MFDEVDREKSEEKVTKERGRQIKFVERKK